MVDERFNVLPDEDGGETPFEKAFSEIELPELNEAERKAMNSIPPDFIDRILRGERPIKRREDQP